ncbi:MAG: OOP family OmpA-OmpF porin [Candidatus Endobugula sp.]|jgi:OOP family OmpA-OmpF porin
MKNIANILALTIVFGASSVYAADNNYYIGLGYGSTDSNSNITNTTGSIRLDESDSGFKIFAGYQFNKNIAVEGFYTDLGSFSLTGDADETYTLDGQALAFLTDGTSTLDSTTFGVAGVFSFPINETVSPYAKLGFHRWEMEGNQHLLASSLTNDDGTDPMYGLGINVSFNNNLQLRIEYERLDIDSQYASHVDYTSVGLAYSF